jgi:DNA-binding GntR family transcriptional regulator
MRKIVKPRNLTALAYEGIKRHILEGKLDENSRLTEDFLAQQFEISKSPIREALNSLQTEGLIRIEPRRGAYLRRYSIKEVKDLYDLREALEVYAVDIAELNDALFVDLSRSIKDTRRHLRAKNKIKHIEEDANFHATIARAAGNAELCRVLENIQHQIWLCRCQTYDLSSSSAPRSHQDILDALEKKNRRQAKAAMREHIAHVRQKLLDFLDA